MLTVDIDLSPGTWLDWTWQSQMNLMRAVAVGQRAKQLWDQVLSPPWSWECSPTEPLLNWNQPMSWDQSQVRSVTKVLVHLRPLTQFSGSVLWSLLTLVRADLASLDSMLTWFTSFSAFPDVSGYWLNEWFYEIVQKQSYWETATVMNITWRCQYSFSACLFYLVYEVVVLVGKYFFIVLMLQA